MTRKDCENRSLPYTLAFRLPVSFRHFLYSCQNKLETVCKTFEPIEQAHLTIKFLGYSSEFLDEKRIVTLLPQISSIADKYLPVKIFIRGFDTFSYSEGCKTVIFLKVLPNERLRLFHNELCRHFQEFEIFPHADLENFQPHITLSKDIDPQKKDKMQRLISRSNRMAKRHLKVSDLVVMTPYRLYKVSKDIPTSLICPPPQ